MAESAAWEAVRRANGGEMPEEQEREEAKRPADEPTDEEMVEALAPIVAREYMGHHWEEGEETRARAECDAHNVLRWNRDSASHLGALGRFAIASWKAARAWRKK